MSAASKKWTSADMGTNSVTATAVDLFRPSELTKVSP